MSCIIKEYFQHKKTKRLYRRIELGDNINYLIFRDNIENIITVQGATHIIDIGDKVSISKRRIRKKFQKIKLTCKLKRI